MEEDDAFLRAIVDSPDDPTPRLVYADWLEERGDPRAELLRSDWNVPRLSFLDWLASRGDLDYYLERHPELRSQLPEHEGNLVWRRKLETLGATIDQGWLAIIDTVARPFQPFFFWNNTGPRSYHEGQFPFREQIGTRGLVLTFASAFQGHRALQPGLAQDLDLLRQLPLVKCYYGGAGCPVHPFIGELETGDRPLTGTDVLRALKTADFRSQHVQSLNATALTYPGYRPGTDNDEIHNNPERQYLFPHADDEDDVSRPPNVIMPQRVVHKTLQDAVVGRQLWYVLLHSRTALRPEDMGRGFWVILFAVGRSLRGDRLIGVVSHQSCHNLCD